MFDTIIGKLTSAGFWQTVGPGLAACLIILIIVIVVNAKRTTKHRSKQPPPLARTSRTGKATVQQTTADRPLELENPTIGFLNLMGDNAAELLAADRDVLSPLFQNCEISTGPAPKCQVLFVYCALEATGQTAGCQISLRDSFKEAGAYIAVVASENAREPYAQIMQGCSDWYANIALCLERKGEKFAAFFRDLFSRMFQGKSMLTAWVELAPQIPGIEHPDGPETVMLAEAGHIVFRHSR